MSAWLCIEPSSTRANRSACKFQGTSEGVAVPILSWREESNGVRDRFGVGRVGKHILTRSRRHQSGRNGD